MPSCSRASTPRCCRKGRCNEPPPGAVLPEFEAREKKFEVSFLASRKSWTEGHRLRQAAMSAALDTGPRVEKNLSPPRVTKEEFIGSRQFDIAIENEHTANWFTEKVLDCFLLRTVPIYWGCPNLGDFGFNAAGVLRFGGLEELRRVLGELTPGTYESMRSAVEDNYRRARDWANVWDRVETAVTAGIERKRAAW